MPAQLFPAEKSLLYRLAQESAQRFGPNIQIVNIGVRQGGSLHCLRAGAPEAILFGVDVDLDTISIVGDPRATLVEGDSNDQGIQSKIQPPIHLLFIDGDHSYEAVSGDIKGWTPKVVPGGIVALHDYHQQHHRTDFGIKMAIDEWMQQPSWEKQWKKRSPFRIAMTVSIERRE